MKIKIHKLNNNGSKHIYLSIEVQTIEDGDVIISKEDLVVIVSDFNNIYTTEYVNSNIDDFRKIVACTDRYFYSYTIPKLSTKIVKQIFASKKRTAYIEFTSEKKLFIDPNDGWKYGFPKYCDKLKMNGDEINQFIEKEGYPIKKLYFYRTWVHEVKKIKNFELQ